MSSSGELPPYPDPDEDETGTPTRQCSRCREFFPVDDSPLEVDHASWWLCGPCHDKLIGNGPPRRH